MGALPLPPGRGHVGDTLAWRLCAEGSPQLSQAGWESLVWPQDFPCGPRRDFPEALGFSRHPICRPSAPLPHLSRASRERSLAKSVAVWPSVSDCPLPPYAALSTSVKWMINSSLFLTMVSPLVPALSLCASRDLKSNPFFCVFFFNLLMALIWKQKWKMFLWSMKTWLWGVPWWPSGGRGSTPGWGNWDPTSWAARPQKPPKTELQDFQFITWKRITRCRNWMLSKKLVVRTAKVSVWERRKTLVLINAAHYNILFLWIKMVIILRH